VAVMSPVVRPAAGQATGPATRRAALAGILVGLGFAIKVTIALTGLGLALALGYGCWRRRDSWRAVGPPLAALGAGFAVTAGAALAIGGSALLRQTSQASDMVSIGSPWRVIRSAIHLAVTGTAATDIVKAGAVALAVLLAVLLIRGLAGPDRGADPGRSATIAFALALAWLFAWPYVLPWYDALGWALLPLVPAAGIGVAEGLGWLLLARTTALGFGYLPARQTDAPLPSGLGWLQPVIRHGMTPAVLAGATVWLLVLLARSRRAGWQDPPGTGEAADSQAAAAKAT
jgi:hypothetical protein